MDKLLAFLKSWTPNESTSCPPAPSCQGQPHVPFVALCRSFFRDLLIRPPSASFPMFTSIYYLSSLPYSMARHRPRKCTYCCVLHAETALNFMLLYSVVQIGFHDQNFHMDMILSKHKVSRHVNALLTLKCPLDLLHKDEIINSDLTKTTSSFRVGTPCSRNSGIDVDALVQEVLQSRVWCGAMRYFSNLPSVLLNCNPAPLLY